jgi:hypothetical protein
MYKEMKKIQTGNQSFATVTVKHLLLKSETNMEMETNFRILSIYFFFWHKNVRVGGKNLGLVGRSETHYYFLALATNKNKLN